jgi:class 3 adenylate cyclase
MLQEASAALRAGKQFAEGFDCVTIIKSDICSYTQLSSGLTPEQVVSLLSQLYSQFDDIMERHGLWKVETVGDAYMAASGAFPRRDPHDAAARAVRAALDMVAVAQAFVGSLPPVTSAPVTAAAPGAPAAGRAADDAAAVSLIVDAADGAPRPHLSQLFTPRPTVESNFINPGTDSPDHSGKQRQQAAAAQRISIRVGMHSGPVYASVISHKMPYVALIGSTTHVTSKM